MTSLREKIGAMLMLGFRGTELSDNGVQEIIRDIKDYNLGGVILFKYNIVSPEQLSHLTSVLKQVSSQLLIAADQEGGKVQRLSSKNFFKDTESAKNIANHYSLDKAYQAYSEMAEMLKAHGINFNFAPVVDVDKNPPCSVIGGFDRSYSMDVKKVIEYTKQFIDAHRDQNVLTSLKHFPGHGFAKSDTHKGLTDVTDLANPDVELEPYKKLLADATHTAVMTAHIVNRNLDDEGFPATLSQKIITGILREQFGFQGVVVTDALEMAAIKKHYSLAEVVVKAINAGNDILIFSRNSAASFNDDKDDSWNTTPKGIIEIIEAAISDGRIPKSKIEESYKRISNFKNVLNVGECPFDDDISYI